MKEWLKPSLPLKCSGKLTKWSCTQKQAYSTQRYWDKNDFSTCKGKGCTTNKSKIPSQAENNSNISAIFSHHRRLIRKVIRISVEKIYKSANYASDVQTVPRLTTTNMLTHGRKDFHSNEKGFSFK